MDWFGFYLKKRKLIRFFESFGNKILNCGAPQELILGPILFLLYLNDMKTTIKNLALLRLYTDGTCILPPKCQVY